MSDADQLEGEILVRNTPKRKPALIKLLALFAALAMVAAACGSDPVSEAASDAADAVEDAVDGDDEEAMEDDEEAMEDDEEAMEDDEEAMEDDEEEAEEPAEEAPSSDTVITGDFAGDEITVAIVGNPTMEDIVALTPEFFTDAGGPAVNYVTLEEQTLREIVSVDIAVGAGDFDAVMIGPFEAPQFGANGWLNDLSDAVDSDPAYDSGDLIPAVRGALSTDDGFFALPFYAESSFIMFNQEIMDANNITFSDEPTWEEVAAIARQVDTDEVSGICLRGLPGWGDFGAPLTTVVNTFGGTWWEANADGTPGEPQINQADSGFRAAFNFYVDLLNDAGQDDPATSSFPQCLELLQQGQTAMWYDATVAAGILEGDDSPLQGNLGVALAPRNVVDAPSGWLWSWALAVPVNAPNAAAATEYAKWATSPEYIQLAGEEAPGGWAAAPPGTRVSTYAIPEYQAASESFGQQTLSAIQGVDPTNPGTTPRPGLPGVQYVGIPEFQSVGTACTTELAAVLSGGASVDDALDACQAIAQEVTDAQ